ncbi:hypothetical protein VNO77_16936 [Canavalia gladiata]|uniref:Uncharacterized protein n=1 Tax=Canavalia gladiata TaxID=3824 RepID=A0AAN9QIW9_CANGL
MLMLTECHSERNKRRAKGRRNKPVVLKTFKRPQTNKRKMPACKKKLTTFSFPVRRRRGISTFGSGSGSGSGVLFRYYSGDGLILSRSRYFSFP